MIYKHATADVAEGVIIGENTYIWHQAQIREGVTIGKNCIIGKGVYIDKDVTIGSNVKIQNYASIYHGTTIEKNVFIGPYVCFTNDKYPRAVNSLGEIKNESDWIVGKIKVKKGASISAGAIILPGIIINEYAIVGAGAVVTKSVEKYTLVFGSPARPMGKVCKCGKTVCQECKHNQ